MSNISIVVVIILLLQFIEQTKSTSTKSSPYLCQDISNCCNQESHVLLSTLITELPDGAFKQCRQLQSIVIPDTVIKLGIETFKDCSSLQSVILPKFIIEIPNDFCWGCNLLSINIPPKVTNIGYRALNYNANLKHVIVPGNVKTLGWQVFYNCYSLKSLVFQEGVEEIQDDLFAYANNLLDIVLPDSLTKIGRQQFSGGPSVCVYHKSSIPRTGQSANSLPIDCTYKQCSSAVGCCNSQSFVLLSPNIILNDGDFSQCHNMEVAVIPNGVSSLPSNVFRSCEKLEYVALPSTLTLIGEAVFGMSKLKEMNVPEGVLTIGTQFCIYCDALNSVYVPNTLSTFFSLANGAFYGCSSLRALNIPNVPALSGTCSECTSLVYLQLGDGVMEIGNDPFTSAPVTCVNYDNTIYRHGALNYGFHLPTTTICPLKPEECKAEEFVNCCKNKEDVYIASGITSIPSWSFQNCHSMKRVTLPSSLQTIESNAFSYSSIEVITIPDTVLSMGSSAFSNCASLKYVTLSKSLYGLGAYTFSNTAIESIELYDSLTTLGTGCFKDSKLKTIEIPNGVSIQDSVFEVNT